MDHYDLDNRFSYHPPKDGQAAIYEQVRTAAKDVAVYYRETCPDSRELSLAITHLEEAVFWANAAIARNT